MNPERINIKDLTIEEPEKQEDLPFDPERDVTKEDWVKIDALRTRNTVHQGWHAFAMDAMFAKILDPETRHHIMYIDGLDLGSVKKVLEKQKSADDDGMTTANLVVALKIIDPSYIPYSDKDLWKNLTESLKYLRSTENLEQALSLAAKLKIIHKEFNPEFTDNEWKAIREKLENEKAIESLVVLAADMKVLNLGHNFEPSDSQWELMRSELEKHRKENDYDMFLGLAGFMKILAAEKVEITDTGLEITMPAKKTSLSSETTTMPEQRNF